MVGQSPRLRPKKTKVESNGSRSIPRHVAIIMDGNGRWAQERGLSRQAGHRAGTENIRAVIRAFAERDVQYLTLFAFSTENWNRPRREVSALLRLIGRVLDRELQSLHERNVRLLHIGNLEPLSPDLQRRILDAIELTRHNTGLTVCVAFNYGGRAEIIEAAKRLVEDGVPADRIDEQLFGRYLNVHCLPDPDLGIRTGREMRISNFLLWQAAYAEYYFSPVLWPDFDAAEADRAIEAYAQRDRRYGGLSEARPQPVTSNGAHAHV
jgi:undecaprenyl diphosphate synthase